jgi:Bacteriophage clamp loader A subunit
MDLFKDIIPSILQTKKDVFIDDPSYRDYNPYMVNKALSNYPDTVMAANNMNMNYHLHKQAQYNYYLNSVRAMKRPYAKWFKAQKEDDLEAVKLYFGYSSRRAREAIKLLTDEQIDTIRKITTIGD